MIEPEDRFLSIRRQCELLDLFRRGWYYGLRGLRSEDIAVMHLLDEQYTRTPFYGVERMTAHLRRPEAGIDRIEANGMAKRKFER